MGTSESGACSCTGPHVPRLVVVTGGPGAGKTAVLEVARRTLCRHVVVLPEAATIVFGGGFPRPARDARPAARAAAQRAILHVQRQLESLALDAAEAGADTALVLCDRGTLDGLAYWPGGEAELLAELHTTRAAELRRYAGVVHLRPPGDGDGYRTQGNPVRRESADEAARIDARIEAAWREHPARTFVPASTDFLDKAGRALVQLRAWVPACCRPEPR